MVVLPERQVDAQLHVVALERTIAHADPTGGEEVALVHQVTRRGRYSADSQEGHPAPARGDLAPDLALESPARAVAIAPCLVASQVGRRTEQTQVVVRDVAPRGAKLSARR